MVFSNLLNGIIIQIAQDCLFEAFHCGLPTDQQRMRGFDWSKAVESSGQSEQGRGRQNILQDPTSTFSNAINKATTSTAEADSVHDARRKEAQSDQENKNTSQLQSGYSI